MRKNITHKEAEQLQKNAIDGIKQALQDAAKQDYEAVAMMKLEAWINYADAVNEYIIKERSTFTDDNPAPVPPK